MTLGPKMLSLLKARFFLLKSKLFRDNMKTPIAFMLGLFLSNVACLPQDVAKVTQKTETEDLSRERRYDSNLLNTTSYSHRRISWENLIIFCFPRAVGGVRKRQSGSSNTAADCNFSKGIKVH